MSYVALSFPYPPYSPFPVSSPSPLVSSDLSPGPLGMLGPLCLGCWGLATMWAAPRR